MGFSAIASALLVYATALLLLSLTDAQYPVVVFPESCAPACAGFPSVATPICLQCTAMNFTTFSTWTDTQQPPIQRLPYYEKGYTKMPAMFILSPFVDVSKFALLPEVLNVWTTVPESNTTVCVTESDQKSIHNTSRRCITRSPAPQLLLNDDGTVFNNATSPLGCIIKQGWLSPSTAPALFSPACPGSPNLTYSDVTLTEPEHLAMMYPTVRNLSSLQPAALVTARQVLTNVTAAADSVWTLAQMSWNNQLWFHNVTPSDINNNGSRVRKLYGKEWQRSWTELARSGNLIEQDHTWFEGITSERWHPATHTLLRYMNEGGRVWLRAIAVRLSNVKDNPHAYKVYTPEKSETAFIKALLLVRSSMATTMAYAGHIYNQHLIASAAAYSLYNAIDPGVPLGKSTHPVRLISDEYANPRYNANFFMLYMAGLLPPTPSGITYDSADQAGAMLNAYAIRGPLPGPNSMYGTSPQGVLARSNLDVSKFTSVNGKPWDLYPAARYYLDIVDIATDFTSTVVNAFYPTDSAVANDSKVQSWLAAMLDPMGGNLFAVNKNNKLNKRSSLSAVLGHLVGLSLCHLNVYMLDFTSYRWNLAMFVFSPNVNELFSETSTHSLQSIVEAATSTHAYSKQLALATYFDLVTQKVRTWVPYKCPQGVCPPPFSPDAKPDYNANLPYDNSTMPGQIANAAVVKLRRAVPRYIATTTYTKSGFTVTDPDKAAVMLMHDMAI